MLTFRSILEQLFHAQKWLPPEVDNYQGKSISLRFSSHAQSAAGNDRYGAIDLKKINNPMTVYKHQIVEAETDDRTGKVTKLVVRKPYDQTRDVVIVVLVPDGVVKTVWFNLKSDQHRTLNLARYAGAPAQQRKVA